MTIDPGGAEEARGQPAFASFNQSTAMVTCSKCGTALRQPNATFCHACGGAAKPDAPNTAAGKAWQARLRASEHTSAVWRLLWILTGPLAVILFPLHIRAAALRLRRHVRQRVESPVFATPRFTDAEEGRQIVQRLASCGRGWTIAWAYAAFALVVLLAGVASIVPLTAPSHVHYEDALAGIFGGGFNERSFVYVGSAAEYEAAWRRVNLAPGTRVDVDVRQQSNFGPQSFSEKSSPAPYWDGIPNDTINNHRPFEYVRQSRYDVKMMPPTYRVEGLTVTTRYDRTAISIIVWTGIAVLYLTYLLLGVQFWRRFARHAGAEALAAAYARSDTALLDKLLPGLKARNSAMIILGTAMAVFPLQLLLFPFVSSIVFVRHEKWEQRSGVADALGM